jgi:N-acetylmuramoyl-L-alanine amidase
MEQRSRAARRYRVRAGRKQLLLVAAVAAGAVVLLGAVALASRVHSGSGAGKPPRLETSTGEVETPAVLPASHAAARPPVEVPNVVGRTLTEAVLVLQTAGFVVVSKGETSTADGQPAKVVGQSPPQGTRIEQGEQVSITLAPADAPRARPLVVVLDPGHQAKADPAPEPIGPGSAESKEKATVGACGVATKRQECQVALEVALRVKARLEAAGIQVQMTRTTNTADSSNIQRAQLANRAGANLFVRIHADAGANPNIRGVSVLYPADNAWTTAIMAPSRRAALAVDASMARATNAPDGGVASRGDLAGFNWSKVPAILVETGYLSNADDDRLLANPGYQDKLAAGIANGVLSYLGR